MLKERIVGEMKRVFGEDEKRIAHALRVLTFAEELLSREPADRDVVIAAAILHDIGIHQAEEKHGSHAGKYQEIEGPPIARRILATLDAKPEIIEEVCDIIGHHHSPRKEETLNFKLLYDADMLTNLLEETPPAKRNDFKARLQKMFFTPSGFDLAYATLFGKTPE